MLSQILLNDIQQLVQLKAILQNGGDTLGLLQSINQGINDSLMMAQSLGIHVDPGLYGQVASVSQGSALVTGLFGPVVDSPLAPVQRNTDQAVAESMAFNHDLYAYTDQLDTVGETIKTDSHAVSPGGAAKLTAESIGILIHVMNEQMRATGQGLKLQTQTLALENMRQKQQTQEYLQEGQILQQQMTSVKADFELPRF
ncbi:MAG: hypothetical protein P4M08_13890 [Oligoflexia bacterium]|nr:hypothetical protein [Oligoflexia bacterium]